MVNFFADAVDDDAAHAVRAHQNVVVLALEAGFADHVTWAQFAAAGFDLLFADFTDVPGGVRHKSIGQITTARNREHFQHGNVSAVGFDESHVSLRSFRLDD